MKLSLVLLVPVLGCAAPPRAASRPPAETANIGATVVDAAAPSVARANDVVESGAVAAAPCAPLVWVKGACVPARERPEPMSPEEATKWYADRGARAPAADLLPMCHESRVGPSSEEAIVCERMTQPFEKVGGIDVFRVVLNYVIVTVRKGRAVTLFDRASYLELLDKDVLEQGPLFALDVDLSTSGNEVVVRELAPDACANAAATLDEEEKTASHENDKDVRASALAWTRFDRKMLRRVCANVGRYPWSGGVFSKAP